MEFQDVVRRRRMVRRFDPDRPVDPASVDRMLENAVRAPSAGFSQGWAFVVLDSPADVERLWRATTDSDGEPDAWLRGMRTAPVLVVPLSCKDAYLDRYAQADKGWSDRDEARWPVPYWDIDTGMASLLVLQTAVDEGLGACFFGIPPAAVDAFRAEFGVPGDHMPIGAIAVGHRVADAGAKGSPTRRARRPLEEVVHRGGW
ncbi:MAG: nitroreductase family protein [Nocardioidaceae bacterium]